jgi:Mn-dependent DtxR family transcriptional regulator
LTETGKEVAEKIYERHTVLTKYLVSLGVPEETASVDACKIEHVISDETFNAIKKNT